MRLPFLSGNDAKQLDDLEYETQHKLVIYDEEQKTCDITTVVGFNDTEVFSRGHRAPLKDCSVHISEYGRVYTINAPTNYINETRRLARLEQSIVLQQITNYKEPEVDNPNGDLFKWALFFLLFVALVGFIIVA